MSDYLGLFVTFLIAAVTGYLAYLAVEYAKIPKAKLKTIIFCVVSIALTVFKGWLDIVDKKEDDKREQIITNTTQNQTIIQNTFNNLGYKIDWNKAIVTRNPEIQNTESQTGNIPPPSQNANVRQERSIAEETPQIVKTDESAKAQEPAQQPATKPELEPIVWIEPTSKDMQGVTCISEKENKQLTRCCFINRTGHNLIMNKYVGLWAAAVEDEPLSIPANTAKCSGLLMVNAYGGASEKNFTFYFTTDDGTPCKTPYIITLKACREYTVTLTKGDLGFKD